MKKKYELIPTDTKIVGDKTLYRIKSLIDFTLSNGTKIYAGDLGGYIENENNLSHAGNAWVYGNAEVSGNAEVCGNARVYGNAWVCGDALVSGDAQVYGDAWVCGDARVYGDAQVYGDALVCGNARVCGDAEVSGNAEVYGNARVYGNAWVCGNKDILTISNIGSRGGTTTFFRTTGDDIGVKCGCFSGTIDEFAAAVENTHGDNKYGQEYRLAIQLAKLHIGVNNDEQNS